MKVESILFFLIALLIVSVIFVSELHFSELVMLLAVLGFSPFFWEAKDRIGSDLPFFALCMLALYLMTLTQKDREWRVGLSLILGVVIYLSFAARTVGATLLVCLIIYEVIVHNGISRSALTSAATALVLICAHSLFFWSGSSYRDQIHPTWWALAGNLRGYFWELHHSLWPFYGGTTARVFTLVLLGLGIAGYISRIRSGISVLEVFTVSYTTVILSWTSDFDTRFLIPVLPLWLYYVISYVRMIATKVLRLDARVTPALLFPLFVTSYISGYTHTNFGPIREGVGDPRFLQACAYIRTTTAPGAVIIFAKPRLLALMTNRRAEAYHQPSIDSELWRYFASISADYVLISGELRRDVGYMHGFIGRQKERFSLKFENKAFALYQIRHSDR